MKSLVDDILNILQGTTFSVEVPNDHILDSYPTSQPDFSHPYIIVHEVVNIADIETFTHKEEYSIVSYDIELYTRQTTIGGQPKTGKYVARILCHEIDNAIATALGLVRIMSPEDAPYEYDSSVTRKILTYEGTLDLTSDYIYTRR